MLKETKRKIRVGERESEKMGKGVRQSCSLSPNLFTLLLAKLEEDMKSA